VDASLAPANTDDFTLVVSPIDSDLSLALANRNTAMMSVIHNIVDLLCTFHHIRVETVAQTSDHTVGN